MAIEMQKISNKNEMPEGQSSSVPAHPVHDLEWEKQQLSRTEAMARMGHWHWVIGEDRIYWSEGLYNIFGVSSDSYAPSLDSINRFLYKRDLGRLIQGFQRAILEKKDYDMDFRILRSEGDVRYVWCEGRCEFDEEGEVVALYGIMQDITERVLYEKELTTARDAAERAYAAKSQFLANMSHELRTPLNAVIGFSEMMQREVFGALGNEKYKEYVTSIRESGEHLLDLIADILDMSKIEAGKYELDLQDFEVGNTVKMVTQMMTARAEESGITLNVRIDDKKCRLVGDRRALTQILLNLLSNAVKFTRRGGEVTMECLEREDYILFRVTDTGIGIPANRLPYITQPFEQVACQYSRDHEGSGLGLAITKELVELHMGSLHIDSQVGQGTIVSVRLPYDVHKERVRQSERDEADSVRQYA